MVRSANMLAAPPRRSRVSTSRGRDDILVGHYLSRLPRGRVLNLGAGLLAASSPGAFVVNVDHASPKRPSGKIFVVADVLALPFRTNAFDGILAKDVLEHLTDPVAALAEVRRVSYQTTVLLVTVPRAIARAVWDDPTHVRGFTANALRTALRLGGWRADAPIRRSGRAPGFGRPRLIAHLELFLRLPGIGHWFGTNWIVFTEPSRE